MLESYDLCTACDALHVTLVLCFPAHVGNSSSPRGCKSSDRESLGLLSVSKLVIAIVCTVLCTCLWFLLTRGKSAVAWKVHRIHLMSSSVS